MKSAFLDPADVDNDELLRSFLKYVPTEDKDILENSLKLFPDDTDELVEILDRFKSFYVPKTVAELTNILTQIAHKELVQKPRFVSLI